MVPKNVVHTCDVFHIGLQSAKEYYEQALMQELKKNQELQEYIRMLENRMQHPERDRTPAKQVYQWPMCQSVHTISF